MTNKSIYENCYSAKKFRRFRAVNKTAFKPRHSYSIELSVDGCKYDVYSFNWLSALSEIVDSSAHFTDITRKPFTAKIIRYRLRKVATSTMRIYYVGQFGC